MPVDIEKLKEMWLKGYTVGRISKELGISRDMVKYYRKRLGLPQRKRKSETIDVEKFKEMWMSMPADEIAKVLGMSASYVRAIARRLGLPSKRDLKIEETINKIVDAIRGRGVMFGVSPDIIKSPLLLNLLVRAGVVKSAKIVRPRNRSSTRCFNNKDIFPHELRRKGYMYWVDDDAFAEVLAEKLLEGLTSFISKKGYECVKSVMKSYTHFINNLNIPNDLKAKIINNLQIKIAQHYSKKSEVFILFRKELNNDGGWHGEE